jgi:hypothetical protein
MAIQKKGPRKIEEVQKMEKLVQVAAVRKQRALEMKEAGVD